MPQQKQRRVFRKTLPVLALGVIALASIVTWKFASSTSQSCAPDHPGLPRLCLGKMFRLPAPTVSLGLYRDEPSNVAWTPDGKSLLATHWGGGPQVWDYESGKDTPVQLTNSGLPTGPLSFLNSNQILFTWRPTVDLHGHLQIDDAHPLAGLMLWDIRNGSLVKRIPSQFPNDHIEYDAYAVSPDKKFAAAYFDVFTAPQLVKPAVVGETPVPLYSTDTWDIVRYFQVVNPRSIAFSPDSKYVAFGTHGSTVVVYDVATGQLVKTLHPFESPLDPVINTLAYSADGQFIAVGSTFYNERRNVKPVRVVRVADDTLVGAYADDMLGGHEHSTITIRYVAWHPLSNILIFFSANDNRLHFWKPETPNDLGMSIPLSTASICAAFSPDGNRLAVCDLNSIAVLTLTP